MKTIKLIKLTTLFLGAVSILSIIETCTKKIESNNQTNKQDSTEYTGHKPIEISLDGSSYSKSFLIKSDQEGVIETTSSTGTKYTFAIPKNAVSQNDSVRITIIPIINVKNLPQHKKFLAAIQFEPEGLALLKPAILTIIFPESVPKDSLVGFSYQGVGNDFHLIPIPRNDSILSPIQSISMPIVHFSGVIVGLGTLSDCANQGYPTDPQSIYEQGIACVWNNAYRTNGEMTQDDINQLHYILISWYDQLVLPKLQSATNLDELKDAIENNYLRWASLVQMVGFDIQKDFKDQSNNVRIIGDAMCEKDLSQLNINCSSETDPCKRIKYYTEFLKWHTINQLFFDQFKIKIDFPDLNNFCAGKMLTTITSVKIKGPREITMNTIDSIKFTAELKNGIIQPIDGKVSWMAVPIIGSVDVGRFRDSFIPTFYGRREGEAIIVASAMPVGSSNPLDCVKDTVRVKVIPDCGEKPLQPDCPTKWEGTVQIPAINFENCGTTGCNCNGNCKARFYYLEDLKLTLQFNNLMCLGEDIIGTLDVTGTETINDNVCYYGGSTDEYCAPLDVNEKHSMDQTSSIGKPWDVNIIDIFNGFLSSYNDFAGTFRGGAGYFDIRGSIHGNSGSITITHYDKGTDVYDNVTYTEVNTEVVLTKISK